MVAWATLFLIWLSQTGNGMGGKDQPYARSVYGGPGPYGGPDAARLEGEPDDEWPFGEFENVYLIHADGTDFSVQVRPIKDGSRDYLVNILHAYEDEILEQRTVTIRDSDPVFPMDLAEDAVMEYLRNTPQR